MIAGNIKSLRDRIAEKCIKVKRNPEDIKIIAVSKNFGVNEILEASKEGINDFGENWTINSRAVNSAHFTFSRRVNNRGYNSADINLKTLGVSVFQLIPNGLQLTVSTSGKSHGFTIGGGTNSVAHFNDNAFSFNDDITLVRGKHQFMMGGELVRNQLNISNGYQSNGNGTFNGLFSSNGPTATGACVNNGSKVACAAGDANLDFLSGAEGTFQH